jgi:hypothetical protein
MVNTHTMVDNLCDLCTHPIMVHKNILILKKKLVVSIFGSSLKHKPLLE